MSDERSYRCPSCHGVVSIPSGRRLIDLDYVRAVHVRSCPGRGVTIKDNDSEET